MLIIKNTVFFKYPDFINRNDVICLFKFFYVIKFTTDAIKFTINLNIAQDFGHKSTPINNIYRTGEFISV